MVHTTALRITARHTRRLTLVLLVALGATCALADRVNAAGTAAVSESWQLFDPFTLKLSAVTSPSLMQGVIRLRPETQVVVPSSLASSRTTAVTSSTITTNRPPRLRQVAILVPYRLAAISVDQP